MVKANAGEESPPALYGPSAHYVPRDPPGGLEKLTYFRRHKHNDLRRNVQPTASNMLEMSWSSEAAANTQKWANTCSMNHSPDRSRVITSSGCGENLYMSSSQDPWSNAIQDWYDEVQNWRYGVGSNGRVVGHYTQVVWYRSNKVGCGVAYCPNSQYKYFYVCQYCPPQPLSLR
ncbi:cysteine-rich venom protein TEL1-like [Trematomus bernacchii]|uniref:cysteine-rich venom protein TEL1-like n=1 Tax=Trematomus bernacchii TaxID=40690 RepID=UPI00146C79F8|nr:cysteine-rich venom protein TEL1-like [Trematomus bernacchii]